MSEHSLLSECPITVMCRERSRGVATGRGAGFVPVWQPPMNIRFVSSLTPEDEERIAPGVVNALSMLLDQLPLAYTLRIETAEGKVFQHAHTGHEAVGAEAEHLATRPLGGALRPRTS